MNPRILKFLPLSTHRLKILSVRNYATKIKSSNAIRQQFLDFFIKENGHHFVKSSSVIPLHDPSLAFANAGMNQFKNILLGNQDPKYRRVANTQKCIRVGGKHNDLSVVGSDTYHHTFFEMLGNWSFGDYFKKEACAMAWRLLTEVYAIPKDRLYVTYFKGDNNMGLKADLECRDIWLELGVSKNRVVPFGAKENFWEMAKSGPCGGCTEIHIDHLPSFASENRAHNVNQDRPDLTELWNLVFIEHFRKPDGTIENLKEKHVDTGMGFERLVAFLQGKSSNYDTDLFIPIMEKIQEATRMPIYTGMFDGENKKRDTSYRVLADHSRMIAISLADGMFPEQNQKLRRVLRKCIMISEKHFHHENLLNVTIPVVANILGETFPELNQKIFTSLEIVKYEQELFKMLRENTSKGVQEILEKSPNLADLNIYEYPGFIPAYKEFKRYQKSNTKIVDGEMAFQLYSTYGLDTDLIERFAEVEGMTVDFDAFEERMNQMKRSNETHFNEDILSKFHKELVPTKDDAKHDYSYSTNLYKVKPVKSRVVAIIDGQNFIQNSSDAKSSSVKIIVKESPFYCESGGQQSDEGYIVKNGIKHLLKSISSQRNFIIHEIENDSKNPISVNDEIELKVNDEKRTNCIRNHTATHILNAAVRKTFQLPTYQKSSAVTSDHLKIELAIIGPKINERNLEDLEKCVRKHITENVLERKVKIINSQELEGESNVIMVPGEIYPENGIRVINFGDFSKELCCGTHAFNTSELIDFAFINVKSTGKSTYVFTGVTGHKAIDLMRQGDEILKRLQNLKENVAIEKFNDIMSEIRKISKELNSVAHLKRLQGLNLIKDIKEDMKQKGRSVLSELLAVEMKSVLEENEGNSFVVHYLSCSDFMKSVSLEKATRLVEDKPVIILSLNGEEIKARCVVPQNYIDSNFNAEKWLSVVGKIFKSKVENPRGKNPLEICFMKAKKIKHETFHEQLENAIEKAKKFAMRN